MKRSLPWANFLTSDFRRRVGVSDADLQIRVPEMRRKDSDNSLYIGIREKKAEMPQMRFGEAGTHHNLD
jgi:hypothetical protein